MKKILMLFSIVLAVNSCTTEKQVQNPDADIRWITLHEKVTLPSKGIKSKSDSLYTVTGQAAELASSDQMDAELIRAVSASSKHKKRMANKGMNQTGQISAQVTESSSTQSQTPSDVLRETKENGRENGDYLLYITSALMGLATFGLMKGAKKPVTQLTKWSKQNPKKAKWAIAGLQFSLITLAFQSGYNLRQLGFDLSDNITYLYAPLVAAGFFSVPFFASRNMIAIPKKLNMQRMAYLGITLSSLMITTGVGNRVADHKTETILSSIASGIDQAVFGEVSETSDDGVPMHTDKANNVRKAAGAASCFLGVLLSILMLAVLCGGVCLIVFAVTGEIHLGFIALGILVCILAVKGIQGAIRLCR